MEFSFDRGLSLSGLWFISGFTTREADRGIRFNYIFHHSIDIFNSIDKTYGAAFELLITYLYSILNYQTDYQIYYFRHLMIFLSFFAGTIFFYLLVKLRFKSQWSGLLGAFILILSPRIFESAFVNSKDIPFMVFSIISLYTLFKLDEKMRVWDAIIHGAMTGFLIAIRPIGLLMVALTGLLWLIKMILAIKISFTRPWSSYFTAGVVPGSNCSIYLFMVAVVVAQPYW